MIARWHRRRAAMHVQNTSHVLAAASEPALAAGASVGSTSTAHNTGAATIRMRRARNTAPSQDRRRRPRLRRTLLPPPTSWYDHHRLRQKPSRKGRWSEAASHASTMAAKPAAATIVLVDLQSSDDEAQPVGSNAPAAIAAPANTAAATPSPTPSACRQLHDSSRSLEATSMVGGDMLWDRRAPKPPCF